MKIGILTFHRSYNYGAFMQSYALSRRIKQDFPEDDVEIVDYVTARMYRNYNTSLKNYIFGTIDNRNSFFTACKKIVKFIIQPMQLKRTRTLYSAFERDLKYLPLSKFRVISDDCTKAFDAIRGKYDVIVVGSDGVWEFISYSFPNAYYLGDDLHAVKMSYAASSDRMHINIINEAQKALIAKSISELKFVGIRDDATENFLNAIIPNVKKTHTCDPTFLLEMGTFESNKPKVRKMLEKAGIDLSKPIIGFMCGDNIADRVINHFGNKYQYVSVYWYNKNADAFLNDLTPTEWAVVFSFFVLTVTRFFHGTILSLKNTTPTLTVDEWSMEDEQHISKLEDLYIRLDLKEHYCRIADFNNDGKLPKILESAERFINNIEKQKKIIVSMAKEAEHYKDFKMVLDEIRLKEKTQESQ
ncbi:MAG: polysaccharide pyruvyl transferase family protein [Candidatus Cloacimonetes bacterium]|nr:polysaccharide pyruvyl transferase family protein [Candidatus Cloacimonadota bacterium]MDY0230639.1 polysaccharide pyruvyl transferase family protein [Candidatus Cloacimonadaceae bacterium]